MDQAIDALLKNERISGPLSAEFQTAVALKSMAEEPKLNADFDAKFEALMLKRLATKPKSFWRHIFASTFAGATVVAAMAFAVFFTPETTPVQNLAQVQDFEPLSRAEILLGQLPSDALTAEGESIAEIRKEIHEINLQLTTADTTLNPEQEEFAHVQLRNNALELIELQQDFYQEAAEQEEERLLAFNDKVLNWPTTNEGVSFEVHAKAVNGYLKNKEHWEEVSYDYVMELLEEIGDEE